MRLETMFGIFDSDATISISRYVRPMVRLMDVKSQDVEAYDKKYLNWKKILRFLFSGSFHHFMFYF